MRVLHVDLGREMRGGQWQVLSLLEGMPESRFLARAGSPLLAEARRRGLKAEPFTMRALLKAARSSDLAHAHDAQAHQWMACLLGGKPFVVSRRVAFPPSGNLFSRWKYSRATHYLAVSEYVKHILESARVPASKISVVYDGVELAATQARPERVVAVDTEDPMKGTALLREAAVLGKVDVLYSTDLMHDLRHTSVFVYITHSEGLGSAALLAMAAGIPVVASRVGGLPEIVEDKVTGVLVGNNPVSIASGISYALKHRAELGQNAMARVAARFTKQAMIENTMKTYAKVLAC
jgi:hypothetical protein